MSVIGPQSSVNLQRMICGYDEVRKHHSMRSTQTVTVKKKKMEELSREEREAAKKKKKA